jgi:hypothetical protein
LSKIISSLKFLSPLILTEARARAIAAKVRQQAAGGKPLLGFHNTDWDNAYANGANIAGGDRWPAAWVEPAKAFRDMLQSAGRVRLDIA